MKPKITFPIKPRLPENLKPLLELARNLWWDWNYDAIDLFRRISRHLWREGEGNPLYVLLNTEQERINYISREEGFLNHMERVLESFSKYVNEPRWYQRTYPENDDVKIAYFSAEYGLSTALPVYSGGLGLLSGDHLKTASDMGLPLVAIGLAYRQGYFHQYLNVDGWQQERYDENDFYNLPACLVKDDDGKPFCIDVPYLGNPVRAEIWRVDVGRVPLYLLSTNLPQNLPADRVITDQLYGGDNEMRIRQEIVLGIGGVIALRKLKIQPTVFHMNEGHSAFLAFERIRDLISRHGLSHAHSQEASYASSCFTTHTPVPAGNDVFASDRLKKYLEPLASELGQAWSSFLSTGSENRITDKNNNYCMTVAAIRNASHLNGVSKLHAHVSRGMWNGIWPDLPRDEVPIRPITNGVHLYSWISHDIASLFDRYLGPVWRDNPLQADIWHRIYEIPDEELWRTHERRRARLVAFARTHLEQQLAGRGASQEEVAIASEVLNPEALTIVFARRFATYKRGGLLFRDIERLKRLCGDKDQPVQFIFAGKAHPRDDEGKRVIREIIHAIREEPLRYRFTFLEDYDIGIARYLVQGADIWLNTPRRPLEASGTSGMKAVANGALHLSVLDGWWDQAYHADYGWAIGKGEEYDDLDYQDEVEGNALYDLLEKEIVSVFFNRSVSGIPRDWVAKMKRSMANLIPRFSSHRMLWNYLEDSYLPADAAWRVLSSDDFANARVLADWRQRIEHHWDNVHITHVDVSKKEDLHVGEAITVSAIVDLNELLPDDVLVEAYAGPVDSRSKFQQAKGTEMVSSTESSDKHSAFSVELTIPQSGYFGLTVRVIPRHEYMPNKHATYKVTWANDAIL